MSSTADRPGWHKPNITSLILLSPTALQRGLTLRRRLVSDTYCATLKAILSLSVEPTISAVSYVGTTVWMASRQQEGTVVPGFRLPLKWQQDYTQYQSARHDHNTFLNSALDGSEEKYVSRSFCCSKSC